VQLQFVGVVFEWRGPAPYYYLAAPEEIAEQITEVAAAVSYGWGVIPVTATIGSTTWTTSLFPKGGTFLVPLKASVRQAENLGVGDSPNVALVLDV
jgi:hypothetical protein